jgi:hypothetical protein
LVGRAENRGRRREKQKREDKLNSFMTKVQ